MTKFRKFYCVDIIIMPQFYQLSMSKNIKFYQFGFVVKATYNSSGFSSMLLPDSLFDVVARFLESVFCWKERKNESLFFLDLKF
jgi:hypothetical protein